MNYQIAVIDELLGDIVTKIYFGISMESTTCQLPGYPWYSVTLKKQLFCEVVCGWKWREIWTMCYICVQICY